MKSKIISLVVLFIFLISVSLFASAEDEAQFVIKVNFKENLLFSKYSVALYVDDIYVSDIEHGHSFQTKITVPRGEHTLYFYKTDNHSVFGAVQFTDKEYLYMITSIETKRNRVEIKETQTEERYGQNNERANLRICDGYAREYLQQYDVSYHVKDSRRTYYYSRYLFFNTKGNQYISILVAKGDKVEDVEPITGTYSGSFTGTIITSDNGQYIGSLGGEILVASSIIKDNQTVQFKKTDNNTAIWTLIHYVHPDIYNMYSNSMDAVRRSLPEFYELFLYE